MQKQSQAKGTGAGGAWKPPLPERVTYYPGGSFDVELVQSKAEEWARRLQGVRNAQIRRFYEYVQDLRRRLDLRGGVDPQEREKVFKGLKAEFLMLKARAIYAHKRSSKQFSEDAMKFFINHAASVENARDFEAFCRHFEAVVAFHYPKEDKDGERE